MPLGWLVGCIAVREAVPAQLFPRSRGTTNRNRYTVDFDLCVSFVRGSGNVCIQTDLLRLIRRIVIGENSLSERMNSLEPVSGMSAGAEHIADAPQLLNLSSSVKSAIGRNSSSIKSCEAPPGLRIHHALVAK